MGGCHRTCFRASLFQEKAQSRIKANDANNKLVVELSGVLCWATTTDLRRKAACADNKCNPGWALNGTQILIIARTSAKQGPGSNRFLRDFNDAANHLRCGYVWSG